MKQRIVYVAGSSRELARVRTVMSELRQAGFYVYDWAAAIEAEGTANGGLLPQIAASYALFDLAHVRMADAVVFLAPKEPTQGAWVEYGFSLALGKRVLIVGHSDSIFARLGETAESVVEWAKSVCSGS